MTVEDARCAKPTTPHASLSLGPYAGDLVTGTMPLKTGHVSGKRTSVTTQDLTYVCSSNKIVAAEENGVSTTCSHPNQSVGYASQWRLALDTIPNEILLQILSYLDVCDLLSTSRANHVLRSLSLTPVLHHYRLRQIRLVLPPLISPTKRPPLADLITKSIFLTHTTVVSRRLARSLVSIRLSRRLASRPSPEALVERAVLPPECVPGLTSVHVVPGLIAKRKAIEKEKVKDGLRQWIASKWKGEVREREDYAKRCDESCGVGRVWRLTKFWEKISRGDGFVAN